MGEAHQDWRMNAMEKHSVVGVIPAAGKGSRLWLLPGSKELLPIGSGTIHVNGVERSYPKVVSQYLIDSMVSAGVKNIYFILSEGKWDIARYYRSGNRLGIDIAYLHVDHLWGMPYTINQVHPWIKSATIVFGMPDTIFKPRDAFKTLLDRLDETNADLILGLFPTNQPSRFGMVQTDDQDYVHVCIDKPSKTDLNYMWGIACWNYHFSSYLNNEMTSIQGNPEKEIVLGDYFQKAVDDGLKIIGHKFEKGEYIDVGTHEDIQKAIQFTRNMA